MYASLVARNGGFLLTVVSGNDCLQFGQPNIPYFTSKGMIIHKMENTFDGCE